MDGIDRLIRFSAIGTLGIIVCVFYGMFIGFTPSRKVDALFLRCQLRGGQEITRAVLPGPVDYECFVNGKVVDSYRMIVGV